MRSSVLLALLWATVVSLSLLVVSGTSTPLRLLRTSNSALQPVHSEHTWVETHGQVNEGEGIHAPPVVDLNAPYDYDPYLAVASAFGVNVASGQRPDLEIVRQLHKATFQGSENPALYTKARKREAELNAKIGAELKQILGRDPVLKEIKQEKGKPKWRPAIEATKLTNGEVRVFIVANQRRLVTDAQHINLADWVMGQPRTRTVVHPTTGVGSITYKLDKFGRVIEASGPTRMFTKGLGTKASAAAVAWSNAVYRFHFDAAKKASHLEKEKSLEKFTPISVPGTAEVGHIFGASPGGSNDDTINFFPQDTTSNKNKAGVDSAWSVGEHLAQALQQDVQTADGQVRIRITLEYKKASDLIPYGGEYQVLWANGLDQLLYKGVTVNAYVASLPAGWEYASMVAPVVVEKAQPGYHSRTWKWTNPIAGL